MQPEHSGAGQKASKPERPQEIKQDPKRGWDRVDEASWESFPASDPPAHWAGQDKAEKPPTLNGEELGSEEEEDE